MASQVLSGSSNVSYTNNTGQNVRIVINYMASPSLISWAGVSVSNLTGVSIIPVTAIGRNLAFHTGVVGTAGVTANNMAIGSGNENSEATFPTELILANGQTFSATCGAHNIVVIPEAG